MTYSSALFKKNDDSLEVAQKNKYLRIIENVKEYSNKIILLKLVVDGVVFMNKQKSHLKS